MPGALAEGRHLVSILLQPARDSAASCRQRRAAPQPFRFIYALLPCSPRLMRTENIDAMPRRY